MAKKTFKMTPAHHKFCEHYVEYSNATQAYLFAFPNVTYGTAKTEGSEMLTKPDIKEKIEQLQEEFITQFRQDKLRMIRDLTVSAEEFKKMGDNANYMKAKAEISKLAGLYEPDKQDHTTNGKDMNVINVHIIESPKPEDTNGA